MRKIATLFIIVLLTSIITKAQYVNIPDTVFRTFLISKYPSCFNTAQQMDTTCSQIINEDSLACPDLNQFNATPKLKNLEGLQYFKKLKYFDCNYNQYLFSVPKLPDSLSSINFTYCMNLSCLPLLPYTLKEVFISGTNINCVANGLSVATQWWPQRQDICGFNNTNGCYVYTNSKYVTIPDDAFRDILIQKYPACFNIYGQMDTTCTAILNENSLAVNWQPSFPYDPVISTEGLQYFKKLQDFKCGSGYLTSLGKLPSSLKTLVLANCPISDTSVILNDSLQVLDIVESPSMLKLPQLPNGLKELHFPVLLDSISILPNGLQTLSNVPNNYWYYPSVIKHIKAFPNSLKHLYLGGCQNITDLPKFPDSLITLELVSDKNLHCIPKLPETVNYFDLTSSGVTCVKNLPHQIVTNYGPNYYPVCNILNDINNCGYQGNQITGRIYADYNKNGIKDSSEAYMKNIKVSASNGTSNFSNDSGSYVIVIDTAGTFIVTTQAPNYTVATPASSTYTFTNNDTTVIKDVSIQPIFSKDSITVKLTNLMRSVPGHTHIYWTAIQNVGTTNLNNLNLTLNFDSSNLVYDSSVNIGVVNNGNVLSLNIGSLPFGATRYIVAFFHTKTTAQLGTTFCANAAITNGFISAIDTTCTKVFASFDPNDKTATPELSTTEVAQGKQIDYTIHFQNTGTDTAFNIVVADTLDNKLNFSSMQMVATSHNCKTTIKDNIIFFEMRNIMLPDSNVNKLGSCGFVRFTMQPKTTVVAGDIIPNKAAIYFDYNSPVITNTAKTIIQNPLPLTLLNFSAIVQQDLKKVLLYWNTANEINTSHFVIEQSHNGKDFAAINEVAAIGIGSNSYFYSTNKSNIVYLRLKMIDKNGTYTYSNIIKLADNSTQEFDILTNPVKGRLNIKSYSSSINNSNAIIINAQGQIIKTFILKQGFQSIDITGLQGGMYYLKTNIGAKKFVIIE